MELPTHILIAYGYMLLFAWVLVEQFGVPLPATPILLAAGALSAEGRISFFVALVAGLAAALIADSSWFLVGRRHGHRLLRLLCKLSMEPTVCVRKTQDSFGRRRVVTLLIAKFVPGLALLAIFVFSLIGVPLTGGFFGKFYVFQAALNSHLIWLTVLGLINSAIASYYYLKIIVAIYMHDPDIATQNIEPPSAGLRVAIWASAIGVLILGIFPSALFEFASFSASALK